MKKQILEKNIMFSNCFKTKYPFQLHRAIFDTFYPLSAYINITVMSRIYLSFADDKQIHITYFAKYLFNAF